MRLSTVVIESLALAAVGVLADLKTIQGSFVNIQTATSTLNGAILNVNANPESTAGIAPAAKGVEDALAKARDDVGATDPITLADDPILQGTANGLTSTVKIAIMSIMLQRPMLDQANATDQVLQTLNNQQMLADQLGANVLSKLPPEGIPGAQMAFGGAAGSIKFGIMMLSQPAPPGMEMPTLPGSPPGGVAEAPAAVPSETASAGTNTSVTESATSSATESASGNATEGANAASAKPARLRFRSAH